MIINNEMQAWLEHRQGIKRMDLTKISYQTKALELNKNAKEFLNTFGKKEICAFTGFIDLMGFSNATMGFKPAKISEYLLPFLEPLIDLLYSNDCLIDKTIGDEIMFVLADKSEDGGVLASLKLGQLLGGLFSIFLNSLNSYSSRLGLSFGKVYLDQIQGDNYSEWTVFGEPVNLAKRLHSLTPLKQIEKEHVFSIAFGILTREEIELTPKFDVIIEQIGGFASQFKYEIVHNPDQLKGISNYKCAIMYPKEK